MWMDLESAIQSEVSSKEKNKYINIYVESRKMVQMNLLQSRNRDIDIESKRVDTKWGKKGWDELGDWDWHIYTTMSKRDN